MRRTRKQYTGGNIAATKLLCNRLYSSLPNLRHNCLPSKVNQLLGRSANSRGLASVNLSGDATTSGFLTVTVSKITNATRLRQVTLASCIGKNSNTFTEFAHYV